MLHTAPAYTPSHSETLGIAHPHIWKTAKARTLREASPQRHATCHVAENWRVCRDLGPDPCKQGWMNALPKVSLLQFDCGCAKSTCLVVRLKFLFPLVKLSRCVFSGEAKWLQRIDSFGVTVLTCQTVCLTMRLVDCRLGLLPTDYAQDTLDKYICSKKSRLKE